MIVDHHAKHGIYRVGNLEFYSKLEAIEMHVKTRHHPHWDFNESVFECYDWTVEPNISIQDLYKKRALQLRENYDYLILNYSSGADSQVILDTFTDNNILLDEAFSYINYQGSQDITNPLNDEIFRYAIPYMKQLNETQSWPKHRIVDCSQSMIDFFSTSKSHDWIYSVNMMWQAQIAQMPNLIMSVPEWKDMMDRGLKVCIITGTDKPRVVHVNNKFALKFVDITGWNGNVQPMVPGLLPYSTEYFYWTPDVPELVIKQAHIIKNYLNSGDIRKLPFITKEKTDLAFKIVDGQKYWLNFVGLHELIYPTWARHNRPNMEKPARMLYNHQTRTGGSGRENWFYSIDSNNDYRKNWEIGYQHMADTVPDYWKNDPKDLSRGIKASESKLYFLEKEETK